MEILLIVLAILGGIIVLGALALFGFYLLCLRSYKKTGVV